MGRKEKGAMKPYPARRSVLAGSGAAILAALVGCAPPNPGNVNAEPTIPPADGPVTLTYWAWLKDLQQVCDVFNASQDRIRVEEAVLGDTRRSCPRSRPAVDRTWRRWSCGRSRSSRSPAR